MSFAFESCLDLMTSSPILYENVLDLIRRAARVGNQREIKRLLGNPRAGEYWLGANVALIAAANSGQFNTAQWLVDMRCNLDYVDNDGCSALYYAARQAQDDIVELLLDHGADIDRATAEGMSPLLVAIWHSAVSTVRVLLSYRANTELRIKRGVGMGNNALELARQRPRFDAAPDEIVGMLSAALPPPPPPLPALSLPLPTKSRSDAADSKSFAPDQDSSASTFSFGADAWQAFSDSNSSVGFSFPATSNVKFDGFGDGFELGRGAGFSFAPSSNVLFDESRDGKAAFTFGTQEQLGSAAASTASASWALPLLEDTPSARAVSDSSVMSPSLAVPTAAQAAAFDFIATTQLTLRQAARRGDIAAMEHALVGAGGAAHIDETGRLGRSALVIAIVAKRIPAAKWLLERKASVALVDEFGATALHYACAGGHHKLAALLLDHGAAINRVHQAAMTPLMEAVRYLHAPTVELLLERKADTTLRAQLCPYRGRTVLEMAKLSVSWASPANEEAMGRAVAVRDLLQTALSPITAQSGSAASAAAPKRGAPPNSAAECETKSLSEDSQLEAWLEGRSPADAALDEAAASSHFLAPGVASFGQDGEQPGQPRSLAFRPDDNKALECATVRFFDAACAGSVAALATALKCGAEINAHTALGEDTALTLAAGRGHLAAVSWLLSQGANVLQTDSRHQSALFFAAANGSTDVAQLLLDAKADLDRPNGDGWTPLMAASSRGQDEVAVLLLAHKADLNAVAWSGPHQGETAHELARACVERAAIKLAAQAGIRANPSMALLVDTARLLVQSMSSSADDSKAAHAP